MLKLVGAVLCLLAFSSSCFAQSSIEITRAKAAGVLSFASEFYMAMNTGFVAVKNNPESVVLAAKQKTAGGEEITKQVQLKVQQNEENVKLSLDSVLVKAGANGKPLLEKVQEPGQERSLLAAVKNVFNDHYCFGYILSNEYKEGGFVIDALEMGSAAKEAGLKPGDILTQVDKKTITQADEGLFNDKVLPSCFTGKATEFTVLREGQTLTFTITPFFEPAMLRG